MVKSSLRSLNTQGCPTDVEFRTWIAECEAIVNSRPIGVREDGQMLTPGQLAIGRTPLPWPALDQPLPNLTRTVSDLMTRREESLGSLWRAWKRTYLARLPGRFREAGKPHSVMPGTRVLVSSNKGIRGSWKVGKVISIRAGADGIGRDVEIEIEGVRYHRPIQLICPLENEPVTDDDIALVKQRTQDVALRPRAVRSRTDKSVGVVLSSRFGNDPDRN